VEQGLGADGTLQWYKYDGANRLIEVRAGSSGAALQGSYAYGASNQRLMSVEGSTTTYYAWDVGMTLAEYSPSGADALTWQKSFIYLGGRLLATESGAGTYQYHHPERLGTRLITDSSGGIISEQIHLPYGTALTGESVSYASSANPSKKRFTSYERSDSTKLDHAVNRQYHAGLGRFTQVDPIGMSAASLSDPQTLNLYAYCGNDPINHTDPDGLFFKKLFKWIGKILGNKWVQLAIGIALAVLSSGSGAFVIHGLKLTVSKTAIGVVKTITITAKGWAAIGLTAAQAVGAVSNLLTQQAATDNRNANTACDRFVDGLIGYVRSVYDQHVPKSNGGIFSRVKRAALKHSGIN
jgi:RHS repeat-associated protein